MLFSDESQFEVRGFTPRFVRIRSNGEHPLKPTLFSARNSLQKLCFGDLSVMRVGTQSLVPIEGTMNSDMYIDIVNEEVVVPTMEKLWPSGNGIFQQDLAPCHKSSAKCQKNFDKSDITVLSWQGNSPDLNPLLENLWYIIKDRLRNEDCSTKVKLVKAINTIWYHDEKVQQMCKTLVESTYVTQS